VANLIVSAVSTFDNKGLKKGAKEISVFDKQVQKLGRTFAGVFGTAAIINFGKKSVQAFMADEKAAKALEQQLKNVGYQFSAPGVEKYIASLQQATGVLDDQLRPAFQSLLTVTGSITQSQDALNTALNISAATGKSVVEVSQALAKGYAGQTTALSRLGAGLSKATLKSGDMNKIMAELNSKFSGQSAARLDTYAGKMDLLKVSAENAKEEIGKGILDALSLLGKDNNIQTATDLMDGFGRATADVIVGIGVLASKLEKLGSTKVGGALFDIKNIPVLGAYIAGFQELGASERAKTGLDRGGAERTASRAYLDQLRRETKILKDLAKQRAAELAALKAKSEVDKLKDKFDLERIGYTKALNEATDAETKLRLQAKIAILDNNEALAKKINAEMDAGQKAKDLANAFGSATNALTAQIAKMSAMNDSLINKINAKIAAGAYVPPSAFNIPGVGSAFPTPQGPLGSPGYEVPVGSGNPVYAPGSFATPMSYGDLRITVDTATAGDQLSQWVADMIQNAQRTGYSTSSAGSISQ
jgi:hypothetical protein